MTSKRILSKSCLALMLSGILATQAYAIDAPTGTTGSEISQSSVKWQWGSVPGAVEYEVTVDGAVQGRTGSTEYFSHDLWAGEHSIEVRAVGSDGSISVKSTTFKIIVSSSFNAASASNTPVIGNATSGFQAPTSLSGSETGNGSVTWAWGAVNGAARYEVTVDGAYVGETASLQFSSSNLWTGEHSLTVKAVDASGNRSNQSDTFKLNVTGQASSGTTTSGSAPPPAQNKLLDRASDDMAEVQQKINAGYELVFSDEFNGTELNSDRWHTQLRWDGEFNGERFEYRVINGEDQFYVNIFSEDEEHRNDILDRGYNPFEFDGSTLKIRASKNPLQTNTNKRTYGSLDEIVAQQTFLSGAISTHEKFSRKYGYFEARIKIPSHVGTFPAFWLFHESRAWQGTQRTEIDIMENLGHAPWYIYNSFHYFKNVTTTYGGDANFVKPKPNGQIYTGTDYSEDYHVYAVDWSPGRVVWYIDGEQVSEMVNNEANFEDLYIMLNLAMGGNWTNFPTNSGGLGRDSNDRYPNQDDLNSFSNPALEIDYVRVYEKK